LYPSARSPPLNASTRDNCEAAVLGGEIGYARRFGLLLRVRGKAKRNEQSAKSKMKNALALRSRNRKSKI